MQTPILICPTCSNDMIEVDPDIHICDTCGARVTQLNIFEGADQMEICPSCMGAGCKLCAGRRVIKEVKPTKAAKYKNKKITVDGHNFDSETEARFYEKLKSLKALGEVAEFYLQPKFELLPKFQTKDGENIRAMTYTADFKIIYPDGSEEIVDIKGMETTEFLLKAKLLKYHYRDLDFKIVAELPKKYGGGHGVFVLLSDLKRIRKEAAQSGQAKQPKKEKTKQAAKGEKKARARRNVGKRL
jgi:hypothetical protein